MDLKNTTDPKVAGEFLADKITEQLEAGKKVLWFVTGGSAIAVASGASKIISQKSHSNLTVMLTDERYGPVGYPDSNWQQLRDMGFVLKEAKLIPILDGSDRNTTTENFNKIIERELLLAEYKIGLFGVGPDGHTCGIIPKTEATDATVNDAKWAFSYQAPKFERITITSKTIVELDEGVIFMQGEEKWPVVKDLIERDVPFIDQPAQILKKIPTLTLFTDYQK
ncbi:6-phosphogluconolactonase [Candidatus Nomurabacteria bacterium]|nr:6-phosphogluconolactonase [Candidatus Nomurabacteria bacterium]